METLEDVRLERIFPVSVETLYRYVSSPEGLARWWGPEGMKVPEHALDFTRKGPWFSVMENGEGQRFKVSGHVTHVDPPKSVGFTWAWHDDQGRRGAESHVTLTVTETDRGAHLVIDHRGLPGAEAAENHTRGWTSSLVKLERLAV
ncbi:SRPBCC family protein [Tropicimonas aquimaris]|uniref:SRPBCC domain-containing protein n=1 Tax=Tropicimonas aquimaris TaxID=914152 RepID=A0ABW3IY66_9RHOB